MTPIDDNDDAPVGQVITRREALAVLAGAALFTGGASRLSPNAQRTPTPTPTTRPRAVATATLPPITCVAKPAMTEGPYFVDEQLNRADLRVEPTTGAVSSGVLLALTMRVSAIANKSCTALDAAEINLWHCDAQGVYSDVAGSASDGLSFLRGFQRTDATGVARFTSIYPGWYPGRTPHIHFKVRVTRAGAPVYDFTSQLFFDDVLSDAIYKLPDYARTGRRARNRTDGIYRSSGTQLQLVCTKTREGYTASFDIGLLL